MIGSPERVEIQRSPIRKIRKIHSCVWKLYVKNSQNTQFLPKNSQIFALNGLNFDKSEFSRHIEYDFLKEDHKNNLPKIRKIHSGLGRFIVAFGSYRPITLKLALNGQNFTIPWPKIRHIRIFAVYRV